MLTNTPVLAHEAKLLESVQSFSRNVSPKDCAEVLETLFLEWLGSDSCDCTSRDFRSTVAHSYKELRSLLELIDQNSRMEVGHD